jgi:hypothetical protein
MKHFIAWLLIPVVMSGFSFFVILDDPKGFHERQFDEIVYSIFGIVGTISIFVSVLIIRRKSASWKVFDLGRAAWIAIISVAWLAGVGCGFLVHSYETSP